MQQQSGIPGDIQELEKVQHRAARWAFDDYGQYNSVTSMLKHLGWVILEFGK